MTPREIHEGLLSYRRLLVVAAEDVARRDGRKPERAQLAHLVALCAQATCAEEVTNFLRYQAARGKWDRGLVDAAVQAVGRAIDGLRPDDHLRAEAWRLFALYLARAIRFRQAAGGQGG
ncbi:MAG: hypothetical protein FJW96_10205 [Actinobacteria bacterium]|nr:hypothetical protein [Actinomycetota bacterium]